MAKNEGNSHRPFTFIDLFAGAGGLSEGFIQTGFVPLAHVEMNEHASKTLQTRCVYHYLKSNRIDLLPYYEYELGNISREELFSSVPKTVYETVLNKEISSNTINGIFETIDSIMKSASVKKVDLIIGGPPCQAYSLVGRAQSSHMLKPMDEDPRNYLYKMYAKFLSKYQPKMFVFENVPGIKTAQNGKAFSNLQKSLKDAGYEIDYHEQNAKDFGVLQNRKRIIIVGWKEGTSFVYPHFQNTKSNAIVNDLLSDLPPVERGGEANEYDVPFSKVSEYVVRNKIRTAKDVLTGHVARSNTDRDVKIYKRAIEAWFKKDMFEKPEHKRLHYNELPNELKTHKNQTSFIDRFKVVEGDMPYCHTVLSHLSKDGHYFIHPDIKQCRSITVREAARLQSFPDNYFFEGNRTSQFVQIGNAVPPLMAKMIAESIKKELEKGE